METLTYLTASWDLGIKIDESCYDICKRRHAGKGVDLRKAKSV